MLTAIPKSQTPSEGKQIAVSSATVNEVMYTVPVGKTFVGIATGSNGAAALLINGARLYLDVNSTGSNSTPVPLTLLSGTVVKNGAGYGACLIGVEQ